MTPIRTRSVAPAHSPAVGPLTSRPPDLPDAADAAAPPIRRMSADDRRELVLQAATRAFSRSGYAGTTTDAIAREAGVSQPYVVRMFGTKLELFLLVLERSVDRIKLAFDAVIADQPFDPTDDSAWERLGRAYSELLADRDLLQVMMHGFSASGVPEIGELSRRCMGSIFGTLQSTGATDDRARDFVAHGMLCNVMMLIGAPEHLQNGTGTGSAEALAALTRCSFGDGLALMTEPETR